MSFKPIKSKQEFEKMRQVYSKINQVRDLINDSRTSSGVGEQSYSSREELEQALKNNKKFNIKPLLDQLDPMTKHFAEKLAEKRKREQEHEEAVKDEYDIWNIRQPRDGLADPHDVFDELVPYGGMTADEFLEGDEGALTMEELGPDTADDENEVTPEDAYEVMYERLAEDSPPNDTKLEKILQPFALAEFRDAVAYLYDTTPEQKLKFINELEKELRSKYEREHGLSNTKAKKLLNRIPDSHLFQYMKLLEGSVFEEVPFFTDSTSTQNALEQYLDIINKEKGNLLQEHQELYLSKLNLVDEEPDLGKALPDEEVENILQHLIDAKGDDTDRKLDSLLAPFNDDKFLLTASEVFGDKHKLALNFLQNLSDELKAKQNREKGKKGGKKAQMKYRLKNDDFYRMMKNLDRVVLKDVPDYAGKNIDTNTAITKYLDLIEDAQNEYFTNPDIDIPAMDDEPTTAEGSGMKNHKFKVNLKDGSFGKVFVDLPALVNKLTLRVVNQNDRQLMSRKVDPDFVDLITKRFNPKRIYSDNAQETFKKLVSLAQIPVLREMSKKKDILFGKSQKGGCPANGGAMQMLTVPEALYKMKVVMGEIDSGNNNVQLKNQLSELVSYLQRQGKLNAKDVKEIYNDYIL